MKLLNNHLACLLSPMASGLLAIALLLVVLPARAEPDLLGGDMGLAASAPGHNMIDGGSISTEPPAPKITPAQAAELVRRSTGGQVMGVNRLRTDTGVVYGVKVLNSGRMRIVRVDGQTGQIMSN
jgi:uncharacterized membrane protein YkoI